MNIAEPAVRFSNSLGGKEGRSEGCHGHGVEKDREDYPESAQESRGERSEGQCPVSVVGEG